MLTRAFASAVASEAFPPTRECLAHVQGIRAAWDHRNAKYIASENLRVTEGD